MIGRLTLTLLAAAASPPPGDLAPIHGPYHPTIEPANFVRTIDNRFLPYAPGMRIRFKGVRGTTPQVDQELVLHRTVTILGVTCTVVRDTVSERGRAVERTDDFYAQDRQGNVWYMGEDSFERNKAGRFVKASDSWQAGVNGAKPGIIMPGHPRKGDAYRQEYYPPGQALDEARVLGPGAVTVPYGRFKRVLVTSERSPLEPQTEKKYYAAGVGEVAERVVKGHREHFELAAITRGAR